MTDYTSELAFAREAALLGGVIAMERYHRAPAARQKQDGSWVTEADEAAEAEIRARIARSFPDHNILGEEDGLRAAGGGPAAEGAPTWIVDPIDGTNNYMAGIPVWATLVALQVDGISMVGVVHAPALGETYDAGRGLGARMNDRPIGVDPVTRLEDATVLYGGNTTFSSYGLGDFFESLMARARRRRGFGDFWGHMLVARGAAHVMIEPHRTLSIWDMAAPEVILEEAGGRLTGIDGSRWTPGTPVLTTCGTLHAELVELHAQTSGAASR